MHSVPGGDLGDLLAAASFVGRGVRLRAPHWPGWLPLAGSRCLNLTCNLDPEMIPWAVYDVLCAVWKSIPPKLVFREFTSHRDMRKRRFFKLEVKVSSFQ